jgi:Phage integrase family
MARLKVRHLVAQSGHHYWKPSAPLRAAGFRQERLPDERAAAIARAEELNRGVDAWRAGETTARTVGEGTVAALVADYQASPQWRALRPVTRQGYHYALNRILAWCDGGAFLVAAIDEPRVQKFYKGLYAKTPAQANATLRVLRLLLEYGRRAGYLKINPASAPALIGTPPRVRVWTDIEIGALVAAADAGDRASLGDAVLLALWTAQRQGDLLALTRLQHQPGTSSEAGRIHLKQSKRGARINLKVAPQLAARLDAAYARHAARGWSAPQVLICEATGQGWKADFFRHEFARIRALAAEKCPSLKDLWFLDLRDTAITRLADAGVGALAIADVSGHAAATVHAILKHYRAPSQSLADQALDAVIAASTPPAAAGTQESA